MAHQAPCRRPPPAISWPSSRSCLSAHQPCHRPCHAPTRQRTLLRAMSQPPRPCHAPPDRIVAHARPCRSIVSRHSQRSSLPPVTRQPIVSRHNSTTRLLSCHDTIDCIAPHPTSQVALAPFAPRPFVRPTISWPVSVVSQDC